MIGLFGDSSKNTIAVQPGNTWVSWKTVRLDILKFVLAYIKFFTFLARFITSKVFVKNHSACHPVSRFAINYERPTNIIARDSDAK